MSQENGIVVVGSINMDLLVKTARMPRPGQTVLGRDFAVIPGGKGANQAVAAARLCENVQMIGKVGGDEFGQRLLAGLRAQGVGVERVAIAEGEPSGVALIIVDDSGENAICVAPGANGCLTAEELRQCEPMIAAARVMLLQLELPYETVCCAIELGRRHGLLVVLDPAPAPADPPAEFYHVDVLTPNRDEAELLSGEPIRDVHSAKLVASALVCAGAKTVIIKLGADGAVVVGGNIIEHVPAFEVAVVDTTAAGDAFVGALGAALCRGMELLSAVRYANAAGALACRRFGAQPAMPSRGELERFLKRSYQGGP